MMKLILLACLFAPALLSAQSGTYKPSVITYYSTLDNKPYNTRTVLTYDQQGNATDSVIQKQEKGAWNDITRYSSKYENGRLIEQVYEALYDKVWEKSKTTFTYTAGGKIAALSKWDWKNNSWAETKREEWIYDKAGLNTAYYLSTAKLEGQEVTPDRIIAYVYNDKGLPEYQAEMNGDKQPQERINMKYSPSGKILESVTESLSFESGSLSPEYKYIYAYDGKDSLASKTLFEVNSYDSASEWYEAERDVFTRDDRGNIIAEEHFSEGEETYKMEFAFDETGKRTLFAFYSSVDGGEPVIQNKTVSTYSAGKLISDEDTEWSAEKNAITDIFLNTYTYNDKGLLILKAQDKVNPKTKSKTANYKQTYAYDAQNNMTLMENFKWEAKKKKWVNEDCSLMNERISAYKIEKQYVPVSK
jgi:hypothetical protein